MKNSKVNGSPISQNGRFVNPFSEKFFEGFIAQKMSDVKSFLKYFLESPEAQTEENVKTFFKIFFYGAELRNKVANLTAELDASQYRTFVYLCTIKGASTVEFIKTKREYDKLRTEIEAMGNIADEIEAAMYEAHLDEFVNPSKVRNIKSYLKTVLYNAAVTIDNYYTSEVNYHFNGGG